MPVAVLFLCGTLEPAKSGVADFIHLLASSLSSQGIPCACLAIHDPFVDVSPSSPVHHSTADGVDIFRISSQHSWTFKAQLLKSLLHDLQPRWISLHYVPYAFSARGLPFGFFKALLPLQDHADIEMTAHELWLDPKTSLRARLLSFLQRLILLRLCKKLKPRIVHVTNHAYQSQLRRHHVESRILPLFSAIPFCPLSHSPASTVSEWSFILFGSLNRDWDPHPLLAQIDLARRYFGIDTCRFLSVGSLDAYGITLWDSLQDLPYPAFSFSRLGILPANAVSTQLQLADFGICVAPSHLIEKSSAVAAMLAHGLPIIVPRLSAGYEAWHQQLRHSGYYILVDSSFSMRLGCVHKYPPRNQLSDTVSLFVDALALAA